MTDTTPELFSFDHDGKTHTFEKPLDVIRSPRWLRLNRRRDEIDLTFTIIEEVAGDACIEVIDSMDEDAFKAFAVDLQEAVGATLGK